MILSCGVGDGSGKWEILSEWNSTKFGNKKLLNQNPYLNVHVFENKISKLRIIHIFLDKRGSARLFIFVR